VVHCVALLLFRYVAPNSANGHGGVAAEWATAKIASAYNAMVNDDDRTANHRCPTP
jgi:hypothetical protein